ncbi:MAG TPA: HAD family phosphatase [Candidatus Saccharimonadales bacterium]|nr:HAD family phosphatase [Candidatus Saccharimonadales bacterium]
MSSGALPIKAIVFDCFGVIYNDTFRDFLGRHAGQLQKPLSYYRDLQRQSDLGKLSDADFYINVAAAASEMTPATVEAERNDLSGLDQAVVRLIASLKPDYKIGMLSNVDADFFQQFLDNHGIRDLFDVVIASSETGYVKPQPEIFRLLLRRLGVGAGEVVFIDDRLGNVQVAAQLGMSSILFENAEQTERELQQRLQSGSSDSKSG